MKILFITRKFPPTLGGLENASFQLYKALDARGKVYLVKWGGSNKWLPFIIPILFLRSLFVLLTRRIDIIYLQDGLLTPFGIIFKLIFRKPIAISIAGLDASFDNRFYQSFITANIKRMDGVIALSKATKEFLITAGVPKNKITIIPYGVEDKFYNTNSQEAERFIEGQLQIELKNKDVVISVGRLVERKGIHWFCSEVMPQLSHRNKNLIYLIVGDGPLRGLIEGVIADKQIEGQAKLLGRVNDELLSAIYTRADVFVMPNIKVKGDIEGQGLVLIEAASSALPVVATGVDGIKTTITDKQNGYLVDIKSAKNFIAAIESILTLSDKKRLQIGQKAREFTLKKYGWQIIGNQYMSFFRKLTR